MIGAGPAPMAGTAAVVPEATRRQRSQDEERRGPGGTPRGASWAPSTLSSTAGRDSPTTVRQATEPG